MDGLALARKLIAEEAEKKTGKLDLGNLGLTEVPPEVFQLTHLRELILGGWIEEEPVGSRNTLKNNAIPMIPPQIRALELLNELSVAGNPIRGLDPIRCLQGLGSLDCSWTNVSDLRPLADLPAFHSLICFGSKVRDLGPLAGMPTLMYLDCSNTPVGELRPLAGLAAFQALDCSSTLVSDLGSLADLPDFQWLDCSRSRIRDLRPLARLQGFQWLNCSHTMVAEIDALAGLSSFEELLCYRTKVSDLGPLAGLPAFKSLVCFDTTICDLGPLADSSTLQYLDCSLTPVKDLGPLTELPEFRSLRCFGTRVSSLRPLAGLPLLNSLICPDTLVSDLGPLASLRAFEWLDCSRTKVGDIGALAGLATLQWLNCSGTLVRDLGPLTGLPALKALDCSNTKVSSLEPLSGLPKFQRLDCSRTSVSDLGPLIGLPAFHAIKCSGTPVRELRPLSGLPGLQSLDCSLTKVSDLSCLRSLRQLRCLEVDGCRLADFPIDVLNLPSLEKLLLSETQIPGIPSEVLSQHPNENCLKRLRAHLTDIQGGTEPLREAKLVVLGNGRVGKTQLCRRLRDLPFDEAIPSTHGITVTSTPWSGSDDTLNLWDFGGQDIYHGTHSLFLRTRAIFVIVWHPEAEQAKEHEHEGQIFRNYPLAYWLDYVRTLGGKDSPIIVVQTRCDRPELEAKRLPVADAFLDFPFLKQCCFSAAKDRGIGALREAITDAITHLRERHEGIAIIGKGRMKVLRQLTEWREADQQRPSTERQHRTLTITEFNHLCDEAGGVSSPECLLDYLHHLGVVFHRKGEFRDQIILDQSWALEAVYAVFDRRNSFRQISGAQGRFTRSLLAMMVWRDYTLEQQDIFLGLMTSCGVCFVHRQADGKLELETEYVAPDLLPEKDAVSDQLAGRWDDHAEHLRLEYDYAFLHPGLVRSLVCDAGEHAGEAGVYWKYGVWVYERDTGCRALIEQHMLDDQRGRIIARVQGDRPEQLCRWICQRFDERNRQFGHPDLKPTVDEFAPLFLDERRSLSESDSSPAETKAVEPRFEAPPPEKKPRPEVFVSYAWGDSTPEGVRRKKVVDQLCDALKQAGVNVLRDTEQIQLGERISTFMKRLAQGDLIVTVISGKYLQSSNCMYELFHIYRNCSDDPERFLDRIVPLVLPCAKIGKTSARLAHAAHWKAEQKEIETVIAENGIDILGPQACAEYRAIREFATNTSDILSCVNDKLAPRDLKALEETGYADALAMIQQQLGTRDSRD